MPKETPMEKAANAITINKKKKELINALQRQGYAIHGNRHSLTTLVSLSTQQPISKLWWPLSKNIGQSRFIKKDGNTCVGFVPQKNVTLRKKAKFNHVIILQCLKTAAISQNSYFFPGATQEATFEDLLLSTDQLLPEKFEEFFVAETRKGKAEQNLDDLMSRPRNEQEKLIKSVMKIEEASIEVLLKKTDSLVGAFITESALERERCLENVLIKEVIIQIREALANSEYELIVEELCVAIEKELERPQSPKDFALGKIPNSEFAANMPDPETLQMTTGQMYATQAKEMKRNREDKTFLPPKIEKYGKKYAEATAFAVGKVSVNEGLKRFKKNYKNACLDIDDFEIASKEMFGRRMADGYLFCIQKSGKEITVPSTKYSTELTEHFRSMRAADLVTKKGVLLAMKNEARIELMRIADGGLAKSKRSNVGIENQLFGDLKLGFYSQEVKSNQISKFIFKNREIIIKECSPKKHEICTSSKLFCSPLQFETLTRNYLYKFATKNLGNLITATSSLFQGTPGDLENFAEHAFDLMCEGSLRKEFFSQNKLTVTEAGHDEILYIFFSALPISQPYEIIEAVKKAHNVGRNLLLAIYDTEGKTMSMIRSLENSSMESNRFGPMCGGGLKSNIGRDDNTFAQQINVIVERNLVDKEQYKTVQNKAKLRLKDVNYNDQTTINIITKILKLLRALNYDLRVLSDADKIDIEFDIKELQVYFVTGFFFRKSYFQRMLRGRSFQETILILDMLELSTEDPSNRVTPFLSFLLALYNISSARGIPEVLYERTKLQVAKWGTSGEFVNISSFGAAKQAMLLFQAKSGKFLSDAFIGAIIGKRSGSYEIQRMASLLNYLGQSFTFEFSTDIITCKKSEESGWVYVKNHKKPSDLKTERELIAHFDLQHQKYPELSGEMRAEQGNTTPESRRMHLSWSREEDEDVQMQA